MCVLLFNDACSVGYQSGCVILPFVVVTKVLVLMYKIPRICSMLPGAYLPEHPNTSVMINYRASTVPIRGTSTTGVGDPCNSALS